MLRLDYHHNFYWHSLMERIKTKVRQEKTGYEREKQRKRDEWESNAWTEGGKARVRVRKRGMDDVRAR